MIEQLILIIGTTIMLALFVLVGAPIIFMTALIKGILLGIEGFVDVLKEALEEFE